MLREESVNMEEDTVENAAIMFKKAEVWRRKIKKIEEEEQEALQTKKVSPSEMMKDITLWDDAIKRLCRPLMKRRSEDWKRRTSLVITRKAGGRRKVKKDECECLRKWK